MTDPQLVFVRFDGVTDLDLQGRVLLALEKLMREWGIEAEVYKDTAPDDSRLRLAMTTERRSTL